MNYCMLIGLTEAGRNTIIDDTGWLVKSKDDKMDRQISHGDLNGSQEHIRNF